MRHHRHKHHKHKKKNVEAMAKDWKTVKKICPIFMQYTIFCFMFALFSVVIVGVILTATLHGNNNVTPVNLGRDMYTRAGGIISNQSMPEVSFSPQMDIINKVEGATNGAIDIDAASENTAHGGQASHVNVSGTGQGGIAHGGQGGTSHGGQGGNTGEIDIQGSTAHGGQGGNTGEIDIQTQGGKISNFSAGGYVSDIHSNGGNSEASTGTISVNTSTTSDTGQINVITNTSSSSDTGNMNVETNTTSNTGKITVATNTTSHADTGGLLHIRFPLYDSEKVDIQVLNSTANINVYNNVPQTLEKGIFSSIGIVGNGFYFVFEINIELSLIHISEPTRPY